MESSNREFKNLKEHVKELEEAIIDLAKCGCYCDYGIGHPLYSDHTDECKRLRKLLNG